MAGWLEREIKLLLPDAAAYERVAGALGPVSERLQINHFFDVPGDALRRERIGVRLRSEAGERWLTLKGASSPGAASALVERVELEVPIEAGAFEAALASGLDLSGWRARLERAAGSEATPTPPAVAALLERVSALCAGRRLARQAGFENRRKQASIALRDEAGPLPLLLQLDETRFPDGRTDHEIEVELDEHGPEPARVQRALTLWLASLGVTGTRTASSKFARRMQPREA